VLSLLTSTGVRGCPLCQRGGFRTHEPACLYLLHLPGRGIFEIGVTNKYEFRIREHRRYGLIPLHLDRGRSIWPVPIGEQALAVEEAVLRLWRVGLRLPQALGQPRTTVPREESARPRGRRRGCLSSFSARRRRRALDMLAARRITTQGVV
jgi:hypothetical protein